MAVWSGYSKQEESAYLGFMNAVGLDTRTDVKYDGNSLKPAGFTQGNYIESFGLPVGRHQFVFTNSDCIPFNQAIDVISPAPLHILYKVVVLQNGKPKNALKLTTIPGQPPAHSSYRFFVFYASDRPSATLKINNSTLAVPSMRLVPLEGKSFTVDSGAKEPMRYETTRPGNYVLVLFDGSDSRLHQAFLQME